MNKKGIKTSFSIQLTDLYLKMKLSKT